MEHESLKAAGAALVSPSWPLAERVLEMTVTYATSGFSSQRSASNRQSAIVAALPDSGALAERGHAARRSTPSCHGDRRLQVRAGEAASIERPSRIRCMARSDLPRASAAFLHQAVVGRRATNSVRALQERNFGPSGDLDRADGLWSFVNSLAHARHDLSYSLSPMHLSSRGEKLRGEVRALP